MNQAQLIKHLADVSGSSQKDVQHLLNTLGDVVQAELLEGGEVTLPGLGKFTAKDHAARKGRNPSTGEEIDIAAKRLPHFAAGKAFKDALKINS